MPHDWIVYACLVLGLSSALVGGVFKGFSEFIMKALAQTEPAAGIEAMQNINRTVMRTEFLFSFILLAPLSVSLAAYGLLGQTGPSRALFIAASAVYVGSVFLVTVLGNVPMNEKLAKLDHRSSEARAYWAVYLSRWTRLNHVRTIGSIVTAALYFVAMLVIEGGGASATEAASGGALLNAIAIIQPIQ